MKYGYALTCAYFRSDRGTRGCSRGVWCRPFWWSRVGWCRIRSCPSGCCTGWCRTADGQCRATATPSPRGSAARRSAAPALTRAPRPDRCLQTVLRFTTALRKTVSIRVNDKIIHFLELIDFTVKSYQTVFPGNYSPCQPEGGVKTRNAYRSFFRSFRGFKCEKVI